MSKYFDAQALEAVAKKNWNSDPALREEFLGDFKLYHAYAKAVMSGSVKILGGSGATGKGVGNV